jgi:signal transduction histidine kinase
LTENILAPLLKELSVVENYHKNLASTSFPLSEFTIETERWGQNEASGRNLWYLAPETMSLGNKLTCYLLIGVLLVMGIDLYLSVERTRANLLVDLRSEVSTLSRTLQVALDTAGGDAPERYFDRLTVGISGFENVLGVAFYNRNGDVTSLSTSLQNRKLPDVDVRGVIDSRTPVEGLFTEDAAQRYYRVGPIANSEGEGIAAFLVIEDLPLFTNEFRARAYQTLLTTMGLMGVLALIVPVMIRRGVTQPLNRFAQQIEVIGQGRFDQRLATTRRDEIGRLAQEFDRMCSRLESAQHRLLVESEEKLRLERTLRHSGKLAALGQLASRLAHEIGTPLNVIQGRAEQLLRQDGLAEKDRNFIRVIISQIERISGFLRELLTLARRPEPLLRIVSVNDIVRRVREVIGEQEQQSGVEVILALALEETLPAVQVDPDQLEQVLLNLTVNALQAVGTVGSVTLKTQFVEHGKSNGEATVDVIVADTGPGIHPDDLPRVFEPFFTTKGSSGTGLGLAISREILLNHHGEIRVESEAGRGAQFIVSLPVRKDFTIRERSVTMVRSGEGFHANGGA